MKPTILLTVIATIAFHVAAAPATQPLWQADTFAIGFWCGPPAKFTTLERYREIKDAGFTVALPPCSGASAETNHKLLDLCQQVGLKAFISDSRIPVGGATDPKVRAGIDAAIAEYSRHPALAGYFIADEPGPGAYPALGGVVDYLRQRDPKHFGFINLLPHYAPEWAIGKDYEQYVRGFVEKVHPPLISYDNYGFAVGDTGAMFHNLDVVRKVSLETAVPFWNIVLVTQHGPYRNLTEPELRFEAMTTVAYGAKAIIWFTYWSPAESDKSFDWKHAPINADGTRDPHYDMLKVVNHDTQVFGSAVLKAHSTGIYPTKARQQSPLKFDGDALVTTFEMPDHTIAAMVVNGSWTNRLIANAAPRDNSEDLESFDRATGEWRPEKAPIHIDLAAGDAMLLRWRAKHP
jgi:hypothetical protein